MWINERNLDIQYLCGSPHIQLKSTRQRNIKILDRILCILPVDCFELVTTMKRFNNIKLPLAVASNLMAFMGDVLSRKSRPSIK
jgi:hypothetical protein